MFRKVLNVEMRAEMNPNEKNPNGRKERVLKQFLIFLTVFLSILMLGIMLIFGYEYLNDDEEKLVYEFFQLPAVALAELIEGEEKVEKESNLENELLQEALTEGQKAKIIECSSQDEITLLFAGDILFDDNYAMMATLKSRGGNIEEAFETNLLEKMQTADVFMINNEFTFTDRGTAVAGKKFTFRANPGNVTYLQQMGVDIVSVANNHIYDYGEISLLDTLDTLETAGIPYVGAGRNLNEAMQPMYLIGNGMKIAIVSATQIERTANPETKEATENSAGVLRCMDTTKLLEVIAEAKNNSDFVILYIHWGTESVENIDWLQEQQAEIYTQAGVDLIIGNHPHCLQKIEVKNSVPIVYSLGNFWFNSKTQKSCMIEAAINADGIKTLRFIPCLQSDCRTKMLAGEAGEEILEYMRSLSQDIMIDENGYIIY